MELYSDKPDMLRILSSAVSIAAKAGVEVRRIVKSGQLGVVDKGIEDYQTEADRTVQRMVVASLGKLFPKCKIVGEEDLIADKEADNRLIVSSFEEDVLKLSIPERYQIIKEEDITIWVDPLDGTSEFVKGLLDHVTVLIGLSVRGRSIAGVMNQPFYGYSPNEPEKKLNGRTIWGIVNVGCFGLERNKISNDKLVITTTSSHGSKDINDAIMALNPTEILRVGGAGHKVLLVIEGRAHSYVFASNGCKRWDTCAPEAILESLGGSLTDVYGNHIDYNYKSDGNYHNYLGVIASIDSSMHKKILDQIPENIKKSLLEYQTQNMKSKY